MIIVLCLVTIHLMLHRQYVKRLDIFHIYVLINLVLISLFFFGPRINDHAFEPFLTDLKYQAVVVLGIVLLYVGLYLGRYLPYVGIYKNIVMQKADADNSVIYLLAWLWYLAFAIVEIVRKFGLDANSVVMAIGRSRTDALGAEYLSGHTLYWLREAALGGTLVYIFLLAKKGKYVLAIAILASLLMLQAIVNTTRLGLVLLMCLPIAYYHYRIRRLPVLLLPAGAIAFVLIMSWLNLVRSLGVGGERFRVAMTTPTQYISFEQDMNALRGLSWLLYQHFDGKLNYEYGRNYVFMLVSPIPRQWWKEKPLTAFEPRWTEIYLQRSVGTKIPIWVFTAWGEGLAQFGVLGVALNLFLYGLCVAWGWKMLSCTQSLILIRFYYGIMGATFLRGGFQAVAILTGFLLLTVGCTLWAANAVKKNGRARSPAAGAIRRTVAGRI